MKKYINIILAALMIAAAMSFQSCTKPEIIPEPQKNIPSPEIIMTDCTGFTYLEGEKILVVYPVINDVSVTQSFTVTPKSSNIVITEEVPSGLHTEIKYDDKTGQGTIIFLYAEESFSDGTVTITATNEAGTANATTLKAERAYIKTSCDKFDFGYEECEGTLNIQSNLKYEIKTEGDIFENFEVLSQRKVVHFNIGTNTTMEERSASIIIEDETGTVTKNIPICQYVVDNPLMIMSDYELLVRIRNKMRNAQVYMDETYNMTLEEELKHYHWDFPDTEQEAIDENYSFMQIQWKKGKITGIIGFPQTLIMELPEEIGYLDELTDLVLDDCKYISGTIPESYKNLTKLQYFIISNTQIEGTLPDYINEFTNIRLVNLSQNNLTGTIPECYINTKLWSFTFYGNKLNGELPEEITQTSWWNKEAIDGYTQGYLNMSRGQQEGYRLWVKGYENIEQYPYGYAF